MSDYNNSIIRPSEPSKETPRESIDDVLDRAVYSRDTEILIIANFMTAVDMVSSELRHIEKVNGKAIIRENNISKIKMAVVISIEPIVNDFLVDLPNGQITFGEFRQQCLNAFEKYLLDNYPEVFANNQEPL